MKYTQQQLAERQTYLREKMAEQELDALLISQAENIHYYSNFHGEDSWLVVTMADLTIISDGRYIEQITEEAPDVPYLCQGSKNGSWYKLLAGLCHEKGILHLGFEGHIASFNDYVEMDKAFEELDVTPSLDTEILDCENIPSLGRLEKSQNELAALKRCGEIQDAALKSVEHLFKVGTTEKEFATELEYAMLKLGADGLSFPTIVAAGANGAKPHAMPSDYVFKSGEFITVDFGCQFQGYCGDCTRTVFIGEPDAEQAKVYNLVLEAHLAALNQVTAGMITGDADKIARTIISDAGYGDYFNHSLGHGTGLEIHELPNLRPNNDYVLKSGNVVTVEPGIYISNWGGIRIEDSCIITEGKAVPLTFYPKELKCF